MYCKSGDKPKHYKLKKIKMKSKTTAILLAFFLGGLGIHRFYLGQNGRGLLYLLFSWTGIPLVISIIDAFMLLIMSEESFTKKYNRFVYEAMMNNKAYRNKTQSKPSTAEELERLHDLKERNIITEEEFERKKKELL